MNEQERKTLDDHGGIARTEGPDANGVTTYHAPDGYFVRIGPDGNPRMRGHSAPANTDAQPADQPVAAPAATNGGGMNQQEVEQWIAANGGASGLQYNSSTRRVRNPARMMTNADGSDNPIYDPTAPEWIDVAEESWTNSKTGATLRVSRRPDNSFDVLDNKGADPNKPSNNQDTPEARQKAEEEREKQWNRDNGGLYETHAQRRQREAKEAEDARQQNKPSYITAQDGTVYEVAPGQPPKPIIQGAKPGQIVNVGNGRLIRVGNDGRAEVVYDDPRADTKVEFRDGRWVAIGRDGQGNPTVTEIQVQGQNTGPRPAGPAMPTIVVGQSQAALRQYRDQLQAEVASGRQTQAWADARWAEAKDIATATINEATLLQRERESSLNANVNLATTRLNHENSAIKTALEFALSINGKLPEGSPLGGQAFAALLGMQMIAAKRSGIYDIVPPNNDQRSLEGRGISSQASATTATSNSEITRLTNPGNPQAVQAQRAEVQAQLQQETAQPAAGAPTVQAGAQAAPAASVAPLLPPTPVPSAGGAYNPALAAPAAAPSNTGRVGDPATQPPAINPATGEPTGLSPLPGQPGFAERDDDILVVEEAPTGRIIRISRAQYQEQLRNYPHAGQVTRIVSVEPAASAQPGDLRTRDDVDRFTAPPNATPAPVPDPYATPSPAQSRAPQQSEEFAVLNAYRPTPLLAPTPMQPMAQSTMQEEPLALLQAEASATPPWRMTEEQYQRYKAAGISDDVILSTPGMMVA